MTRIVGKQSRFQWWLLWLAAAGLAAAVSPLGAQDGTDCRFSDVPQSSPQQADIIYACQQGWFEGYSDGTFRPDREVPQRQIATVINRAFPAGSTRADLASFLRGGNPGDPDGSADFDDVAESHPQNRDIAYAVQQGWFQGYPNGAFRPDRTITSNQVATVVGRAFPAGSTRADLATFMRQGVQTLNALTPPTTTNPRKIAYTVPKYDSFDDQVALELWVSGVDGSGARRLTGDLYDDFHWQWSSDGERIAFRVSVYDTLGDEVAYELWVADADGSGAHHLTNDVGLSWEWSPDGNQIAYSVVLRDFRGNRAGQSLWVAGVDGSNSRQLTDNFDRWWWSPDGERIAYLVHKYGTPEYELWVATVDSSGALRLHSGLSGGMDLEWSPDGERIAYVSSVRHSGELWTRELQVVAVDGSGRRRVTNDVSGWEWSPDGEWIVYMVKVRDYSGDKVADELWMMNPDSLMNHQLTNDFAYKWAWSSSGGWIAFESRVWEFGKWLGTGLWVADVDGSNARQLADDIGWGWVSDGERIIYETKVRNSSRTVVSSELWAAGFTGSDNRQLTSGVTIYDYGIWSGDQIIYVVAVRDSSDIDAGELWVVGLDGTGNRRLADNGWRWWGWSLDDGWVTFTASDGGFWVVGLDGTGARRLSDYVSRWAWQPRGHNHPALHKLHHR